MGETRKLLVNRVVSEMDRLKGRIERMRMVAAQSGGSHLDKASYVILRRLVETGPARLSTVAHYFGLDVSTISRHVSTLEEEGLIERVADPADGRAQLLQLTPAGAERHAAVQGKKAAITDEQLADWSKDDMSRFVELLGRYNAAMEQRFGAQGPVPNEESHK